MQKPHIPEMLEWFKPKDTADKKLWRAVLMMAIKDVKSENKHLKKSARLFLYSNLPAYRYHRRFVFGAAGLRDGLESMPSQGRN